MMKKWVAVVLVCLMACAMVAGCSAQPAAESSSAQPDESAEQPSESAAGGEQSAAVEGKVKLAQSMPTLNNPWYVLFANGSKDMADALGAGLNQVTDPESNAWDPGAQIGKIENLIAMSPDAISIDPTSTDGINTAVDEAMGMGIPVIMSGTRVSTDVTGSIVADNKQGGKLCGEYLAEKLGGKGKIVMILGTPGRDVIQNREGGFRDAIKEYPDIEIVAEQVANLERAEAVSVMETILQAHPDIDAVWAANDEMALGAVEALRSQNLVGKVIVGGFDATPDGVEAIDKGEMHFTANQIPYEIGARAIASAYLVATGKDLPSKDVELEMTLVNTENVKEYQENQDQIQKDTIEKVKAEYGL